MNDLSRSLTGAALTGALTLISPSDWSPRVRRAFVLVPGVLVAAGATWSLSKLNDGRPSVAASGSDENAEDSPTPQRPPVAQRVAVPLALGAATCGFQASSLWIDAAIERWVIRRGATYPRRWMAVLAVAVSLLIDVIGSRVVARTANN